MALTLRLHQSTMNLLHRFQMSSEPDKVGTDVWSVGYPLTESHFSGQWSPELASGASHTEGLRHPPVLQLRSRHVSA